MRRTAFYLLVVCAGLAPPPAQAAASPWVGTSRASVRLVTGVDTLGPGAAAIPAGIEFQLGGGWHSYWRTPGDAGVPPRFDWAGSENVAAPVVAWPAPRRLEVAGLQNAVYTGHYVLPVAATRRDLSAGARLALSLDYAVCSQICVPVHADLSLDLRSGDGTVSAEAPLITAAHDRVPGVPDAAGFALRSIGLSRDGTAQTLTVIVDSDDRPFGAPDLFVEEGDGSLGPPARVTLDKADHAATFLTTVPDGVDRPVVTLVDGNRAAAIAWPSPKTTERFPWTLATMLAVALLGGLVLNLMPCVLPVLAIKLSSVTREPERGRPTIRLSFAATAAGILASFLGLAAVPIVLRRLGSTVGWGIQFQQPWFLAVLAVVTVLFAASLFDWLPIGLPAFAGRFTGRGRGHSLIEPFLAGVVSTLLATPCSAPFVGTAVGFALAQGPVEIVAIFASLGLGMALPFLLIAAMPGLVAWLPRPGRWMLHLRKALGLLLLGTALWLASLLAAVTGSAATGAVLGLLLLLLLLRYAATRWPGAGAAGRFATLVTAVAVVLVGGLAPAASPATPRDAAWAAFDPDTVARAVANGRTVLVDVSATWCLTCKLNELSTLDTQAVRHRLSDSGVLRLQVDWSRPDPRISAYLESFGRFGIPFDAVYGPGRPAGEPLPELLTPATLLAALDRAAGTDRVGTP